MRRTKSTYSLSQAASAILLVITLSWLVVSVPFVLAAQEEIAKQNTLACTDSSFPGNEEDSTPLTNTEEKAPNSLNSVSEEYLHEYYSIESFFSIASKSYRFTSSDVYIAFHGELIVPPPDQV